MADTSKEPNLLKHRDVKNSILESVGKKPELGIVPTFSEFIDYVVKVILCSDWSIQTNACF